MMNIGTAAVRAITKAADVTTAAAGAVGGAAVNGVFGGLQGTVAGVRAGLSNGSQSTPAAALTLAALGAAGLVEWPVLVTVGGAALAVHQLNQRWSGQRAAESTKPRSQSASTKAPARPAKAPARPAKAPARKTTSSAARKTTKSPRKVAAPRRATTK
jgi:hypothetical protein